MSTKEKEKEKEKKDMVGKHHLTTTHSFSAIDIPRNISNSIKTQKSVTFYFGGTHYKRRQSTGFVTG
jgi:hypothetical protein